jgi:hypothetical protein
MNGNTGAVFSMDFDARIEYAELFVGYRVKICHSPLRRGDSDRDIIGRVVSVAHVPSGSITSVIVIDENESGRHIALSLAQVRSIAEYYPVAVKS